jgi:hypothetical protein
MQVGSLATSLSVEQAIPYNLGYVTFKNSSKLFYIRPVTFYSFVHLLLFLLVNMCTEIT